jgi:hypothetical protein
VTNSAERTYPFSSHRPGLQKKTTLGKIGKHHGFGKRQDLGHQHRRQVIKTDANDDDATAADDNDDDDAADSNQEQQGPTREQLLKDFQAMPSVKNKDLLFKVFSSRLPISTLPLPLHT